MDREPSEVIRRAIAALREKESKPAAIAADPPPAETDLMEFDGAHSPNLVFAKLIRVIVGDKRGRARWNHLLKDMVDLLPRESDFESIIA
ncbi:MAG TPA: hypothetical protein VND19_03555 [Acetobacteraceae bacterium]|nr:hypothetical protein [Acetobacteraceae bacterium]